MNYTRRMRDFNERFVAKMGFRDDFRVMSLILDDYLNFTTTLHTNFPGKNQERWDRILGRASAPLK